MKIIVPQYATDKKNVDTLLAFIKKGGNIFNFLLFNENIIRTNNYLTIFKIEFPARMT